MSSEVIHLEPPKVPLLKKPEEVHAGHLTEDNDREKKEKEEAFEALYNRKDVKGRYRMVDSVRDRVSSGDSTVVQGRPISNGVREDKGGKVWKKWVVGVAIGLVVVGGVMIGVNKGWLGGDKGLLGEVRGVREVKEIKEVKGEVMEVIGDIDWYAVHLVDGKVYYGHLKKLESDYPELTKVFYTRDEVETATSTGMGDKLPSGEFVGEIRGSKITLVKLGTESHRPEDRIVVNKQNLLFYEKLGADSPILKAIENYLSGR